MKVASNGIAIPTPLKVGKITLESKCSELINAVENFAHGELKQLDVYCTELKHTLTPDEYKTLFANFPQVLNSVFEWLNELKVSQSSVEFSRDIGRHLLHGATLLSLPFDSFVKKTQFHRDLIQNMLHFNPAFEEDVLEINQILRSELALSQLVECPQKFILYINSIVKVISTFAPATGANHDHIEQARDAFNSVATSISYYRPRPIGSITFNQTDDTGVAPMFKHKSSSSTPIVENVVRSGRSQRGSVSNSASFLKHGGKDKQ